MGEYYSSVMDVLYRISMWIAGLALLVMVAVIPVGIFARYVMNSALSWPEPVAILCMVTFTFIGADLMLLAISIFILWYGSTLCYELWQQPVAEFPILTAGENYLPLPIGSAITLLFIIEKICRGAQYQRPVVMLGSTS